MVNMNEKNTYKYLSDSYYFFTALLHYCIFVDVCFRVVGGQLKAIRYVFKFWGESFTFLLAYWPNLNFYLTSVFKSKYSRCSTMII